MWHGRLGNNWPLVSGVRVVGWSRTTGKVGGMEGSGIQMFLGMRLVG